MIPMTLRSLAGPTVCRFSAWTTNDKPAIAVRAAPAADAPKDRARGRAWFRGVCESSETTCDMRSVDL
jgi:hypothetical protein